MMRSAVLALCLGCAFAAKDGGSPVQKVIELLDEMKAKIQKDLAAEGQSMEEFLSFCDGETKEKMFAMKTSDTMIGDLNAIIQESKATIAVKDDSVSELGSHISGKEKELSAATAVREEQNADFVAAEKELVKSVGDCARAANALAKGLSFAQMRGKKHSAVKIQKEMDAVKNALQTIMSAAWIDVDSHKKLKSFLQQSQSDSSDDDLSLSHAQPQAKQVAYESKSGVIVDMIKEMQGKVEAELSALRKKEMEDVHGFKMIEQNLVSEITNSKEKLAADSATKAASTEAQSKAEGELVNVQKTKAADQDYAKTLRSDCETKANEWEAKEKSAKEEMGALAKAKQILADGVKGLFVQIRSRVHRRSANDMWDEDQMSDVREQVAGKLSHLGHKFHSFALMQLAEVAKADPFAKVKGLIEEMIASLLKQAEEEATQKAFCDEEMGKSKVSQADKASKLDKFTARVDIATSSKAELETASKQLEAECAEIDKATAEATTIRTKENVDNMSAMKDFKDSADAVISAIGVLKSFYEGGAAFIQLSSRTTSMSKARAHMKAKESGAGASAIMSILEVAEEDFTRLYAETDTAENSAAEAYESLMTENKISKATKQAELKGKASEIKGLTVQLEQSKEDQASTGEELDAVLAYIDKLKPQCETKAMSYEEKVAKREAEIAGLKEALSILSGTGLASMLQGERSFRSFRRV